VQHHPALPYADMPAFMGKLSGASGRAAIMLRFLIFTACRTNEVVEGGWSEIDRPGSIWKIPGHRMKMDQDHHVPLSAPALAILDELRDGSQCWRGLATGMSPCTVSGRLSRPGPRSALSIRTGSGKPRSLSNTNPRRVGLPARAETREAASSHARLGGLYLGRKCHPVEGVIVTALVICLEKSAAGHPWSARCRPRLPSRSRYP
jgi:integrase